MAIGIDIKVNASQVGTAKREVGFLSRALREIEEHGEIDLGNDRLAETGALVKRLGSDVQRLKSLAAAGDRKGGIIHKDQLQEAEKLSRRIRENFAGYSGTLSQARGELTKLIRERRALDEVGKSARYEAPDAFIRRQERMQGLQAEIDAKQAEVGRLEAHRIRLGVLRREGTEAAGSVTGFDTPGLGTGLLRKSLAAGATLFGGLSVIALLRESFDQAKHFAPAEADLEVRGGRNLRENSGTLGFLPLEHLRAADTLNRRLGYGREELNSLTDTAKRFARGHGITVDAVTGYASGTHQSLYLSAPLFEKHLNRLTSAIGKAGVGGRVEEFLSLNRDLLGRISQGIGGRELSGHEAGWLTSLQAALWERPGAMGKGESGVSFLGKLDAGIRSGGKTPGEQLFLWNAMGGDSVHNIADYERLLERKERGIGDSRNLKAVLELAQREFGSDDKGGLSPLGRLNLRSIFGLTVEQTRTASDMLAEGTFDEKSISRFLEGGDNTARANAAMKLPGNVTRETEARKAQKELPVGSVLVETTDLLKRGALDAADALDVLAERARRFLRPEPSQEQRREQSVLGIGHGSPWKQNPLESNTLEKTVLRPRENADQMQLGIGQGGNRLSDIPMRTQEESRSFRLPTEKRSLKFPVESPLPDIPMRTQDKFLRLPPGEARSQTPVEDTAAPGQTPSWAQELIGEVRSLREQNERRESQIQRVEVINPASPTWPERTTFGSGR